MNHCWSCEREFGYWEVWRSGWNLKLGGKIKCLSCGEWSSIPLGRALLVSSIIGIPVLFLAFRTPEFVMDRLSGPAFLIPLVLTLVVSLSLLLVLSLFVPFVPLYGQKPKDAKP